MSARVFVAGATGVLGRRVVRSLVAAGYTVTANTRDDAAAKRAERDGATPITVDLFDSKATSELSTDHDAIVNIATSIPTGLSAGRKSAWTMNDRLRRDASANLSAAMVAIGGRYVGESITFPYDDGGDEWIDEAHPCSYFSGNETVRAAEQSAADVTAEGGRGVALRFGMFFADDSAHIDALRSAGRLGMFGIPGRPDGYMSWIHIDDAAAAVVAALDAPGGIYNVAEPDPATRQQHAAALARAVGRKRLRVISPKLARLGGPGLVSLTRSQRVSSGKITAATGWRPERSIVDDW
jgi:nucleoside-diphosphate-sugar epimerase